MLDHFENTLHMPIEFVQGLREEISVHPERLGFGAKDSEAALDVFNQLLLDVARKVYGEEGEAMFAKCLTNAACIGGNILTYIQGQPIQKYTLRIALKDIRPTIWRKLEVPSNISLDSLAMVLISAMGWDGYHLYHFRKNKKYYHTPTDEEDCFGMFCDDYDSREYSIGQLLHEAGDKMELEYDFGDSWQHTVTLSKVEAYTDEEPHVYLLSGKNACPPEDCGGVGGYEELCRYYYTRNRTKGWDKAFYDAFVDEDFDPAYFPLDLFQEAIECMQ